MRAIGKAGKTMVERDVVEQLKLRFAQPLAPCAARRVVIWHDPDGEFEERFDALAASAAGGEGGSEDGEAGESGNPGMPGGEAGGSGNPSAPGAAASDAASAGEGPDALGVVLPAGDGFARPVRLVKAYDGVLFAVKRLVAREDAGNDILLYRKQGRGALEGDWLADVELYAEHFQADYLSLLADELGASNADAVRGSLASFKAFFNAKDRMNRFRSCMPAPACEADIELGIVAALLGGAHESDASGNFVVRSYLMRLRSDGPEQAAAPFAKYGALDALAWVLKRTTGFEEPLGERDTYEKLASHVLLTAASREMPEGSLAGYERFVSASHAQFCLNVVREWDGCGAVRAADLFETCSMVEQACGLRSHFVSLPLDALADCDVFPCVNEVILGSLLTSFSEGSDRVAEARQVLACRKDLAWYKRVACYYDVLEAVADMHDFKRAHASGFHIAQPQEVWSAYEQDWWRMDASYRALCVAARRCQTGDVAFADTARAALEEPVRAVLSWADGLYANWFLDGANACWTNAAASQWEASGYVEGVPRQRRFFWETLPGCSGQAKCTVVIISDALRYEVAHELAERLECERGGMVKAASMQGEFPSITEFGMAALLPQRSLSFSFEDGAVFADGLPTASTAQRERVLQAVRPKARALRAEDYLALSSDERKSLVKDASLVYLYHNRIDAVGETVATESDVFDACEDAVEQLCSLAKRICADVSGCRVVITADHGFLFTRDELAECDRLGKADLPENPVAVGKRHLVVLADADAGAGADSTGGNPDVAACPAPEAAPDLADSLFVEMNMDDIGGGSYTGLAPRGNVRLKRSGGTHRYVHGGLSLQELCVPVVTFWRTRTGSKDFVDTQNAELSVLTGTTHRITNTLFSVDLMQEQAAVGKVLPCEYELVFTDAAGNPVSDVARVHADKRSENPQERVIKARFSLLANKAFSSKNEYFLVARERQSGNVAWREKYLIEVAFAPVDDFDF